MSAETTGPVSKGQLAAITGHAPERIGLALSGGGFRATLFHLGVVRLLYDLGLLERVDFVGGVSGGSIIAMHLGLYWDRYCGDPASFDAVAREVLDFCQRDVRNRIIRRWLFGGATIFPRLLFGQSRVQLLMSEYKRLFGNHTLKDLFPTKERPKPRIIAQSLSLTTGQPCSFGRSGFMWYEPDEQGFLNENEHWLPSSHLEIAFAVAASSAFPPLFPPVRITANTLQVKNSAFPIAQFITDGGVYDNLGIERPLWYFEQKKELDAFIVSDAGGTLDWTTEKYGFALPRNLRATEVLMKRVGELVYQRLLNRQKHHDFAFVRINESIASGTLPPAVQRRVGEIRTDLDAFTDLEVSSLIQHGYSVARKELIQKGWISGSIPNCEWFPVRVQEPDDNAWAESLRKSGARRILPLFSLRDWPIWVAIAIILFVLGLGIVADHLWIK